jgi:hypothetical protein
MNAEEMDKIHAGDLAQRLREERRPLCPQFRPHHIERLVQGYCVLTQSPGWFMIPSIEEYREYCTTPRFGECCWFRRTGENAGPGPTGGTADPNGYMAGHPQGPRREDPQPKSVLEGERKQVTVHFADLKDSPELLADRDPEEDSPPIPSRILPTAHP